jgi:hypothetical protein
MINYKKDILILILNIQNKIRYKIIKKLIKYMNNIYII